MSEEEMKRKVLNFAKIYFQDVSQDELLQEMQHIQIIRNANFGKKEMSPLELLNSLTQHKFEGIFPNLCISLGIFLTAPAIVASAGRSFSKLKLVRNYLRSTTSQDRLNYLAKLSIESEIARKINSDSVIRNFVNRKARKAAML